MTSSETAIEPTANKKRIIPWQKICQYMIPLFLLVLAALLIKSFLDGNFHSIESFQEYIRSFGVFGPLILILVQLSQVVLPILPAAVGYAAGAVLFGWAGGFLCNYIGVSIGSILAFYLARRYGSSFVRRHVSQASYDKYFHWTQKKGFLWFLIASIFLPVAPDDLICFLAGLTAISAKKFCIIILVLKPWCLLLYSLFFANLLQWDFLQNLVG